MRVSMPPRWQRPWRRAAARSVATRLAVRDCGSDSAPGTPRRDAASRPARARRHGRRRAGEFQGPNLSHNLALRGALQPIARRHGATVSAIAVAWTLAWPGVTGAIVGARTAGQVDGWIGAATLELTAADLDEIAAAIARTGAGTGPTRPVASRVAGRR